MNNHIFFPGDDVEVVWCGHGDPKLTAEGFVKELMSDGRYRVQYIVQGKPYTSIFREDEMTRIAQW
jgi:hypothetical protein